MDGNMLSVSVILLRQSVFRSSGLLQGSILGCCEVQKLTGNVQDLLRNRQEPQR